MNQIELHDDFVANGCPDAPQATVRVVGEQGQLHQGVMEAGCMARAQRKFGELHMANKSSITPTAFELIGQPYCVDRELVDKPPQIRQVHRLALSKPIACEALNVCGLYSQAGLRVNFLVFHASERHSYQQTMGLIGRGLFSLIRRKSRRCLETTFSIKPTSDVRCSNCVQPGD